MSRFTCKSCGPIDAVDLGGLCIRCGREATDAVATLAKNAAELPAIFAAELGPRFQLVGFRPMSPVPADAFLFVVIGLRSDGTFAKWNYNASAGGFGGGHYDLELGRALELLADLGR